MTRAWMRDPPDPREPRRIWDHVANADLRPPRDAVPRDLIFRGHNCARCASGMRECVEGNPTRCGWPRARND